MTWEKIKNLYWSLTGLHLSVAGLVITTIFWGVGR